MTHDDTRTLETQLMALTRRAIVSWATAHGIPVPHLTHYRKAELVAYVAYVARTATEQPEPPTPPTPAAARSAYRPRITLTRAYGIYRVESESQPGLSYTTDVILGTCDCRAGQFGRACKHLTLATATWQLHRRLRLAARQTREAAGALPVAA